MQMYYDNDANLELLADKTVAVIGYGSQGHAHSLNLKESGVNVVVGLREGSASRAAAEAEGLKVLSVSEASKAGDIISVVGKDPDDEDWWTGRLGDKVGVFPANYVEAPKE